MTTYSHWHVLFASPDEPIPKAKRVYQLTRMYNALKNMETAETVTDDDWSCLSDCAMLMEALYDMQVIQDPDDIIKDSFEALGKSAYRKFNGRPIRLDGPDIQIIRLLLSEYANALEQLPARTMIAAHRKAEKQAEAIARSKKIADMYRAMDK